MDFHNMKRKRLQSLCKKHGIPANLKNAEMAERLSLIYKEKDKSGSSQSRLDDSVMEEGTLQSNVDIIILDEEEETQVNELKSNNTDNHHMLDSDTASDTCQLELPSPEKTSPIADLEESCGIPPMLFKSSVVKTFEVKPNSDPKTSTNFPKSPVTMEQVGNHQEVFHVEPEAVVINEVKSSNTDHHQMVDSDTTEAKGLTMQKTISVVDSEKCIGFSPELLEASVIKGIEPIAFLTPRISTWNMQDSLQSAQMDKSHKVLHEQPNAVDIHDPNLMKISTTHFEYNLVEREDNNVVENAYVHGDHCGDEDEMVSSDPSQLRRSQKRSPEEDLEDSNALFPQLLESSVIEGTETETKFTPRTTDILETCVGEKIIQSVKKQKVDDSQEALRISPNAVVINDSNLWQDSSEELSYSMLEGGVKKSSDNVDVCVIGKSGAEAENHIVTSSLERSNCHKDTPEGTSVTCGFLIVETQSPNDKDMDEAPTQLPLSMPQIEVNSCNSNIHDMNSSDISHVKNLPEKTSPVADSETSTGFSPEPHETSETANLTPVTPSVILGICDMQESIQCGKIEQVDYIEGVLCAAPNAVAIDNVNDIHISTEECSYNLVEGEIKKSGDNINVQHDAFGTVKEEVGIGKYFDTRSFERSNWTDDSFGKTSVIAGCSLHGVQFDSNNTDEKLGICDVQENVQCDKIEQVGCIEEVLHTAANDDAIDIAYVVHVSTEECSYNLTEEVKTSGDAFGTVEEEAGIGKYVDSKSFERSNWNDDSFGRTSVTAGCSLHEVQFDSNGIDEKFGTGDVQESIQCGKREEVDYIEEVLCATPNAVAIDNVNVMHVSTEECNYNLAEGEVKKPGDNIDVQHDASGNEKEEAEIGKDVDTKNFERSICTGNSFGKTSVTAGCSLHEVQFDSNNTDDKPYQFPPAVPQTKVDSYNRNIHETVNSEDTCQLKLPSSDKTSPVADLEESCSISPMFLKSSVVKTFEAKPNSAPKTPTNFPKSCVQMEQVGNHQEVFHVAPDAVVINEVNLLQVSAEEFCQSLVVGDGTIFHDNGTENGGSESEKQADKLGVEKANMAKDALRSSDMTLGYSINELQSIDSASYEDSDAPFMPEHALDTASGDANAFQEKLHSSQPEIGGSECEKQGDTLRVERVNVVRDALGNSDTTSGCCLNELQSVGNAGSKDSDAPFMPEHASDTASGDANAYREHSSPKKSLVQNSEESVGFSPKLLKSSMIQGFEAASNLIVRTPRPRDVRGTFDMKENIQSAKKRVSTVTSKRTAHKRQPLQDIQQN